MTNIIGKGYFYRLARATGLKQGQIIAIQILFNYSTGPAPNIFMGELMHQSAQETYGPMLESV